MSSAHELNHTSKVNIWPWSTVTFFEGTTVTFHCFIFFKKNDVYRFGFSLFAWLISHQPAVLFFQNKPVTSNQPAVLFSQNKSAPAISHQPNEQARSWIHHAWSMLVDSPCMVV
jgi:hypothetical protein